MISFRYENQGTSTYAVYKIEDTDCIDTMSLGMLTNNAIPGLAPTLFTQMDSTRYIKYNVSSKIPVSQFFSGGVSKKRLLGVFSGIVDAMLSAEEYMIDINSIILNLDYIFTDVSTCKTILLCLPIEIEEQEINLGMFFKNIMFSTQFDQTDNCDYVAQIMNYLNSTPIISLANFKKLLIDINNGGVLSNKQNIETNTVVKKQTILEKTPMNKDITNNRPVVSSQQPVVSKSVVLPKTVQTATPVRTSYQVQTPNQVKTPFVQPSPSQSVQVERDKKISMFGLLMHYNKENAQLYKEQKAAKKNTIKNNALKQPSVKKANARTSFAVSGNNEPNVNFAIPGQGTPSINSMKNQNVPAAQRPIPPVKPLPQTPLQTTSINSERPVNPIGINSQQPKANSISFGETVVLNATNIGETIVLNAVETTQTVNPHLIRVKNSENIPINKLVFRIGKERSYVDYFIGENSAISRSHANIITKNDKYFIIDTNSTNHTYVDGQMIPSNTEYEITHESKIRLANEEFEFKLY